MGGSSCLSSDVGINCEGLEGKTFQLGGNTQNSLQEDNRDKTDKTDKRIALYRFWKDCKLRL